MRPALIAATLALVAPLTHAAAQPPEAAPAVASSALVGTMLNVVDPERELAFYREAFGLTLGMTLDHGSKREYMLRFGPDRAEAGIILLHDGTPAARTKLEHGDAFERLVLRVNDMDALVARLDALKRPHDPVRDAGHGYRVLTLTDPEGYRLEVIQAASSSATPAPKPTGTSKP